MRIFDDQMAHLEIYFIGMAAEEVGHDTADFLLQIVIDIGIRINKRIATGKFQILRYDRK
jgi:hypothetical protein